jgi:hypothetical protein
MGSELALLSFRTCLRSSFMFRSVFVWALQFVIQHKKQYMNLQENGIKKPKVHLNWGKIFRPTISEL